MRDFNLPKDKAKLLESPLKENNLLNKNVRISYRNRDKYVAKFFFDEDGLIDGELAT